MQTRATSPSFGLLVLVVAAGSAALGACGDDGNLLGSDKGGGSGPASGGSAGQAGGGSTTIAGNEHAGEQASGGTSSGGTSSGGTSSGGTSSGGTSSGGTAGAGGATCETGLCVRPNVCLDECGGDVVYTGCCPCQAGTVEQLSCSANGGQGSGGQASSDCVGITCTPGQTCIAYRTVGGALLPPDAQGNCENGMHVEGDYCQPDFGYTCAEVIGCGGADTCRCAANTECAHTHACRAASAAAWLDESADLVCEEFGA